jgi:hypothetical protein
MFIQTNAGSGTFGAEPAQTRSLRLALWAYDLKKIRREPE